MNSIDNLWALFDQFKSKQFIGMFSQCHLAGTNSKKKNVSFLYIFCSFLKKQNLFENLVSRSLIVAFCFD